MALDRAASLPPFSRRPLPDLMARDAICRVRAMPGGQSRGMPVERALVVATCAWTARLWQGVWPGLEDDEADPDGAGLLLQDEPLGQLGALQHLAQALVRLGDAADARHQLLDLAWLEHQTLQQGVRDAPLGRLAVRLVLKENLRGNGGAEL